MADLPAPPLPPDVDLRNFPDMPLAVNRLRDSEIASVDDAEIFRCAVLAWCAAWHQVPAASLPDDDATIARLVGMGRDVKGWLKIRAGALRGFVKASDGRLYHRVVAEKAAKSWNDKVEFAWKKECDRIRKANKDREKAKEEPLAIPPKPARISSGWAAAGDDKAEGIPPDRKTPSDGNPTENALKGIDRIGSDRTPSRNHTPPPSPVAAPVDWAGCGRAVKAILAEHWPDDEQHALADTGICATWLADGWDLELDILPTVRAVSAAAQAKGNKPGNLKYFTAAIGRRHAERKAAAAEAPPAENDAEIEAKLKARIEQRYAATGTWEPHWNWRPHWGQRPDQRPRSAT